MHRQPPAPAPPATGNALHPKHVAVVVTTVAGALSLAEALNMNEFALNLPKLMFVVGTRAALAFGVGLLVSEKLGDAQRRNAGRALIAIGALTTIPALVLLARSHETRTS